MKATLTVIDIGSNSTKILVKSADEILYKGSEGLRLSEGISKAKPKLKAEKMKGALDIVERYLERSKELKSTHTYILATSAVRDAHNQKEFIDKIKARTGYPLHVLSGDQEAYFIAQGLSLDENLKHLKDYNLFDLGGGSLECIAVRDSEVIMAKSYPLGAVRLAEQLVKDPQAATNKDELRKVPELLEHFAPHFPEPGYPLIGMGGGISVVRKCIDPVRHVFSYVDIRTFYKRISKLNCNKRLKQYPIPKHRADILPLALKLVLSIMNQAEAPSIFHSSCNLRFGFAAQFFKEFTHIERHLASKL